MMENQSGSIVNLASMAGLNGIPYSGSYVATKHAVSHQTAPVGLGH
jgi:short-subunit dehydrogenase